MLLSHTPINHHTAHSHTLLALASTTHHTPNVQHFTQSMTPLFFDALFHGTLLFSILKFACSVLETSLNQFFFQFPQDGRSSSSAESRSLTDEKEERKSHDELFPVVIAAEPTRDLKEHAYSVYGSPNIDYSKLYSLKGVKLATHNEPLDDGRESPYLAFQRDYFNSASASRSADPIEFPTINEARSRSDHLGGIRYIDPPNRENPATNYYYYSDDSDYYRKRLAKKAPPAPKAAIPEPDYSQARADIIPVPVIEPPKPLQAQSRKFDDVTAVDGEQHQNKQQRAGHVNAVVYSYQNEFGQKTKVGVVLDDEDLIPAETTFQNSGGNTQQQNGQSAPLGGPRTNAPQEAPEPVKIIPLNSNKESVTLKVNNENPGSVYPLGAPYRAAPERPKFFPPQNHPPIFKTRPGHLEGVFGPPLPPKPSPDTIEFPEEHEYGRPRHQSHLPKAARYIYNSDILSKGFTF